ncbi:hypothetical protein psal_cds_565 [Pandoravirus salinus]|uniref:Uncharacterized protein n=1 Tax=Pandoravirus salinus TaxID=1349410 RepID=S4VVM0_9VIRU|nr:hypothetical protein psal_cds_565 [Pandoravirus salinus]AGO84413.1 hypothetical protein psal_cds_565 [Pandoravirus salinus]
MACHGVWAPSAVEVEFLWPRAMAAHQCGKKQRTPAQPRSASGRHLKFPMRQRVAQASTAPFGIPWRDGKPLAI